MNIIMLDCETLGFRPDSVVTQIAAGYYDLSEGKMLELRTWLPDLREQQGRFCDLNTVVWWMQQSDTARSALSSYEGVRSKAEDICNDLMTRGSMLHQCEEVWANPAAFDLPLLTSYFGRKPWHYRQERCLSTIKRTFDPNKVLQPDTDWQRKHDAAYDVEFQCEYLHRLWQALDGFTVPALKRGAQQ